MKFRPCIDLHGGVVKQIVGGTLVDGKTPETNFVAEKPPRFFAELYRSDRLSGGHIIKLGPGNDAAAREALAAWPGGMQLGGGVTAENAAGWIDAGASHVIVTSAVFSGGRIDFDALRQLAAIVGSKRLVLDLSCRRRGGQYYIVTDRWQKFTKIVVGGTILEQLGTYCDEFLVHAVDVEGRCSGVERDLVALLGTVTPIPTTYAGGISTIADIRLVEELGGGRLDYTVGSSLDIFGGSGLCYRELANLST